MITTIIVLNLLVKFGVIKKGSKLHPEQVMVQVKRMGIWTKAQFILRMG